MIIIFEGAATSGKSTLSKMLTTAMFPRKEPQVSEHLSFQSLYKRVRYERKSAVPWYKDLILKSIHSDGDCLIFDRFHLSGVSHSLLTKKEFIDLDRWLAANFNCLLFILAFDERTTRTRINQALQYRDSEWINHVQRIVGRGTQYGDYLNEKQRLMKQALSCSVLNRVEIDVTEPDYDLIFNEIILKHIAEASDV